MLKKIWIRLFLQIAAIVFAFVVVLTLANSTFMTQYYVHKEKLSMQSVASRIDEVKLYDTGASQELSVIVSEKGYALNINDSFGNTLFSSYDVPVADYKGEFAPQTPFFDVEITNEGFSQFERKGKQFLRYTEYLSGGEILTLSLQREILENSAEIANEFILIVATCCLILALFWVFFCSRSIAKPIKDMNDITKKMAELDFSQKLIPNSSDEIGQLALSINTLSSNLDTTLRDLEEKNEVLQSEIDAERRLDKMRKGFVANVSHELKTPISIISGYAEGLKLNIGKRKEQKEYADVIIDEASRMNEMVLNLLELSRLETGNAKLQLESYNLSEQLDAILERFNKNNGVTIETEYANNIIVTADRQKIWQVLQNYLSNAFSHTYNGGTVKVTAVETDNETVKVTVFNNGEEIPYADMEHIWESFWRGETSHKREKDRFGLGLSIVRAIIETHNTSCGVYNMPNGVAFWFTLNKN